MTSFLTIAFSSLEPVVLFGIVCASLSAGFGEITFLSLTARYHKSTVSAWSSGTGAAGLAGSLVYAGLRVFLSPKVALLVQTFVPLFTFVSYFLILGPPTVDRESGRPQQQLQVQGVGEGEEMSAEGLFHSNSEPNTKTIKNGCCVRHQKCRKLFSGEKIELTNKEKIDTWVSHVKYTPHLSVYMVPLFVVFFAEYAINQSFFELLYNHNTHLGGYCLDQGTQYRWLQVTYQVGVFISRSSVSIIHFRHFWIFSVLQVVNFVFFFCATIYLFLPSFWVTFVLVLYEGLLGGAAYVNAFYSISMEVPMVHLEFSMSIAGVADTVGTSGAGVAAIFIHKYICQQFIGYRT